MLLDSYIKSIRECEHSNIEALEKREQIDNVYNECAWELSTQLFNGGITKREYNKMKWTLKTVYDSAMENIKPNTRTVYSNDGKAYWTEKTW